MKCLQSRNPLCYQNVRWLYINSAWLPAVTVCDQKLYKPTLCVSGGGGGGGGGGGDDGCDVTNPIAFVQSAVLGDTSIEFNSPVTKCNLLVVFVVVDNNAVSPDPSATVTDTLGNTYTQVDYAYERVVGSTPPLDVYQVSIWYTISNGTGSNAITVVDNNENGQYLFATAIEYTGIVDIDGHQAQSYTNSDDSQPVNWTITCPATHDNDLAIGFIYGANSPSPSTECNSRFTAEDIGNNAGIFDIIGVSGTTTISGTATGTDQLSSDSPPYSGGYEVIGVCFKGS